MPTVQTIVPAAQRQELKARASRLGLSESKLVGLYIKKGLGDDEEMVLKLARLEDLIHQLKEKLSG